MAPTPRLCCSELGQCQSPSSCMQHSPTPSLSGPKIVNFLVGWWKRSSLNNLPPSDLEGVTCPSFPLWEMVWDQVWTLEGQYPCCQEKWCLCLIALQEQSGFVGLLCNFYINKNQSMQKILHGNLLKIFGVCLEISKNGLKIWLSKISSCFRVHLQLGHGIWRAKKSTVSKNVANRIRLCLLLGQLQALLELCIGWIKLQTLFIDFDCIIILSNINQCTAFPRVALEGSILLIYS